MKNTDNLDLDKLIPRENRKIVDIDWPKAFGWLIFNPVGISVLFIIQLSIIIGNYERIETFFYILGFWIFVYLYCDNPQNFDSIAEKTITNPVRIPIVEKRKDGVLVANQENGRQFISWDEVERVIDQDVPRDTLQISGDFRDPKIQVLIPRYFSQKK